MRGGDRGHAAVVDEPDHGDGSKQGIFNGYCGAESGNVPVSTVAPPVLLQEIELQRTVEGKDRPPILLSPAEGTTASGEVK